MLVITFDLPPLYCTLNLSIHLFVQCMYHPHFVIRDFNCIVVVRYVPLVHYQRPRGNLQSIQIITTLATLLDPPRNAKFKDVVGGR